MGAHARLWLGMVFGLTLLVAPGAARAQRDGVRVVRGLQVSGGNGAAQIVVYLFAPARERTHRPANEGQTLEIDLEPLALRAPGPSATPQIVPFSGDASVPLVEVSASVRGDGTPVLLLRFRETVRFEVSQTRDLDRLSVRVWPSLSGDAANRIDELMRAGRDALMRGDHAAAIRIFTSVLDQPESPASPDAKELLGLARQKNGQVAHAKAEYEDYLRRYPTSEGAERVRQRLDALISAAQAAPDPQPTPKSAALPPRGDDGLDSMALDGTVAQTFWWDRFEQGGDTEPTDTSYLLSDLFVTGRSATGVRRLGATLSAGQLQGFGETDNDSRIGSAFVEAIDRERGATLRLGRQPGSSAGLLGRFDGARMGYRTGEWARLELVSGFPVVLTDSNRVATERPFGGASVELGPFRYWTLTPFAIYQQIDGIEDRFATGAELRFNDATRSLLALADYDFGYGELNTVFVTGSWYPSNATSVNALVDYRNSPILTTTNALIGTGFEEIADLEDVLTEREIRQLAEDRTATAKTFSLGASHELTSHLRVSLDATASNLSATSTSSGVPLTLPDGTPFETIERVPGTDFEYTVTSYLSGTDWLVAGDFSSVGIGHLQGQVSDRSWLVLSGRYPVIGTLRAGPRVVVEYRQPAEADDAWGVKPSLRLDVRWHRFTFEAEGGAEWFRDSGDLQTGDETRYYFALGWRCDF